MLVAGMNPCNCGFLGDPQRDCTCSESEIRRYRRRISGPLLDRIDIHVEVSRLKYDEMTSDSMAESSAEIAFRVGF